MDVVIGIDVGQKVDPTAIAVVELQERTLPDRDAHDVVRAIAGLAGNQSAGFEDHYVVRHLERLPLGTSYTDVAARLAAVVAGVKSRVEQVRRPLGGGAVVLEERRPAVTLFVDATGVGQPVVDLLDVAGAAPIACYFTHGDRRTQDGRQVTIGKAWLVSRLQALLQTGRIHLPKTAEAATLAKELQDYEIKVDQDANDRYGAFKVGSHDDLVTALGLAVQPLPPRWRVL